MEAHCEKECSFFEVLNFEEGMGMEAAPKREKPNIARELDSSG